jgi:Ca-activated chloride channel homolog
LSFKSPELLLFLLLLPAVGALYVWLERRRAAKAAEWSTPALLPNMVVGEPGRRRYVPAALFGVALLLLLVGFARHEAKFKQAKDGATVILMVDVSGSMAANDVRPSRLLAADAALTGFIKRLPSNYRAAVVTFSNHIAVKVPPTYDHNALIRGLPTKPLIEGTAIGGSLSTAVTIAKKAVGPSRPGAPHPPASILLVSDGISNADQKTKPEDAAKEAFRARIPISTISLGTPSGVVHQNVPVATGKTVPVQQQVPVDPKTLEAVAKASGGKFYAAASAKQLDQVYQDLHSRLIYGKQFREITAGLIAVALGLILAGAVLSAVWFRRLV